MVCLRLRGSKGRSNRGATTALQQRHCPTVMATVKQNGREISSPAEKTEMATGTEKRFKFLCTYGGKILPNPFDGQLKYVGGETRVICVPRSIFFLDLKKKVEDLFKVGEIVIKYRLMSEDLDTLVSIRCNDDLAHMWDEYDRILSLGSSATSAPRFLRLFLFPVSRTLSSRKSRKYLDAINGQHMDPTLNCNLEPSREYQLYHHHTEPSIFCHCDDSSQSTEHSVEFPGASCVVPCLQPKEVHRVWSTPNLHGTHQAGEGGAGPSSRTQCGHVYRNHVQLGHSHQQAFGRSETCRYGNVWAQPLQKIEQPQIRVPSYQNLNLACQKGLLVGDRGRSNLVQSPRSAINGNSVQNLIPNNLTHSNVSQSEKANGVSVHKPMHNGVYAQNLIPNSTSEQNLIQDHAGAFGSVGTMGTKHVPLEAGSVFHLQHSRSGPTTPVGRWPKAGIPFQMVVDEQ